MRSLLTYVPLPGHLLLLLLAILMRLPALLLPEYFLPEESLFLACGERITGELSIYSDAWFEGPPLVIWVYSSFISVFGDGAMTAIRIFTALYIYLFAAFFQGALTAYRINERRKNIPGILLVVLLSIPWYGLTLGPALLSLIPFGYVMILILRLTLDEVPSRSALFYSGLFLAALIMTDYAGLVLTLAVFVAYLFLRGVRISELITGVMGMGLGLFIAASWLYVHDAFGSFLDIGFFTYFKNVFSQAPSPFDPDMGKLLVDIIVNWGPFLLLGGFGLFHYRVKLFSYVIVARRLESIMLVWLIFGTIILVFSGSRLQVHDFALIAAPVTFYAAKAWELRKGIVIKTLTWVFVLGPLAILYLDMVSNYQGTWTALPSKVRASFGVSHIEVRDWENVQELNLDTNASLWVATSKAQFYSLLEKQPVTPFVDNRSAFHKIRYINPDLGNEGVSDADLFRKFQKELPDIIIDQGEVVPRLQKRFPTLFSAYRRTEAGIWSVWRK